MISPHDAQQVAIHHLATELPQRWCHVEGVSRRAELIAPTLADGEVLVSGAWLHDIGYAPSLARFRFHPLDGAIALRAEGIDSQLCGLVAFHSAAAYEAAALKLTHRLDQFADFTGLTRDLLWYLDMTTDPDGHAISFEDRMADVRNRYPSHHYVIRALDIGMNEREAAVARARSWLIVTGLADQV